MQLTHVGKYEVKRLLGKGATGSVYLAVDPFQQREVAIKVLERLSSDPEEARRQLRFFQNEAALAGKLRHPHIVSIYDAGLEDASAGDPVRYLVMEVVDGPALTRYCEPGGLLDPMQAVEIGYKCCKALEFANTLGVVHRDIKPANILTTEQGEIKVSDFGAAQLARSDITQVSGVGSPAYMSPEQVRGEEIDFRSDMFSLGGVVYHLLTGTRPFHGATTYELIDNIIPIGQRCSILQLNEATCHWPIGDPGEPEFHFCGRKTCGQLPYCEHHARMAYQPVQMRRRERRFANG